MPGVNVITISIQKTKPEIRANMSFFFYRLFLFSAISPLASPNKQDAASNAIKSPTDELDTVTFGR